MAEETEFRRHQGKGEFGSQNKGGNSDCGWGKTNGKEMVAAESRSVDRAQSATGGVVSERNPSFRGF